MKKINCIVIMVISLNFSCQKNKKIDFLEDNYVVVKYFNQEEGLELKALLITFDDIILKKSLESNELESAYRNFFSNLINVKSPDGHLPIYELDYSKFENLLSPELSDKIWKYSKVFSTKGKFIYEEIDINLTGNYIMFLKEKSLQNKVLKKYYNALIGSGSIASPSLVNSFINNSKNLNLNDESERLIIAIHFITLNKYYIWN